MRQPQSKLRRTLTLALGMLIMPLLVTQAFGVDVSKFETKALLEKYNDEHKVCNGWLQESGCCKEKDRTPLMIRYLSEEEREAYKLEFKDGKAYVGGRMLPHLTADEDPNSEINYMYTMDVKGNIFLFENGPLASCRFHHSSLVSGEPVTGAGHFEIQKGVINYASNCSGHYHPPDVLLDQVIDVLKENGVKVGKKHYYGGKPMKRYRY